MLFLRRPSDERIRRILREQAQAPFTYPEVGATRIVAPSGYPINHHRERIGRGAAAYAQAKRALRRWAMYELPWTTLCWPDAPIEPGATVGVLVHHFGFWSLNVARIIYTLEEDGTRERFGFAFGTLPVHMEQGEERFTVEWTHEDDSVWFEIYTFARGHHWLAKLAPPLVVLVQQRFGQAAVKAMQRAVQPTGS